MLLVHRKETSGAIFPPTTLSWPSSTHERSTSWAPPLQHFVCFPAPNEPAPCPRKTQVPQHVTLTTTITPDFAGVPLACMHFDPRVSTVLHVMTTPSGAIRLRYIYVHTYTQQGEQKQEEMRHVIPNEMTGK